MPGSKEQKNKVLQAKSSKNKVESVFSMRTMAKKMKQHGITKHDIGIQTKSVMRLLGRLDLEILHLAIAHGKSITESELESSSLKRLGVGNMLDALASLRDRGLLVLNPADGSFAMTDMAYGILWSEKIPLVVRILRLLEIQSCNTSDMMTLLHTDQYDAIKETLATLQRRQYVMITPQIRKEGTPQKVYEILEKGLEEIDKITNNKNASEWADAQVLKDEPSPLNAIDEISRMISASRSIAVKEQRVLLQKLSGLYDMLEKSVKPDAG